MLKEGLAEDPTNRERIAKLLRFATTHNEGNDQNESLEDYLKRMQAGQDRIYYLVADSVAAARSSPHLEIFRRKGVEVLLLGDRIDEWLVGQLNEFEGKRLQDVTRGDLELGALFSEADRKDQGIGPEGEQDAPAAREGRAGRAGRRGAGQRDG